MNAVTETVAAKPVSGVEIFVPLAKLKKSPRNGLGFRLVPWASTLEQQLGRQVAGVVRAGGGIDWTLGRKRGLNL